MSALMFGTKYASATGDTALPIVDSQAAPETSVKAEVIEVKGKSFMQKYGTILIVLAAIAGVIYWKKKKGK
jgi:hypothetical protein